MRFANFLPSALCLLPLFLLTLTASPRTESLAAVSRQRYAMGTMFDIVVYHASRRDAERAIEDAMTEIVRLDGVMSDYKADSGLSRLNREGHGGAVPVDPSLYAVVAESLVFSRRSSGAFDVTIAPLLKAWRKAAEEGRQPSADEIAQARRCVGYGHIDLVAPDRIGFRSDCLEIDLGGIGKGYAVDRAMAILEAAGIRHALVNAGTSSIAAIGAPPGKDGWPVLLGGAGSREQVLLLRDNSVSTSQQDPPSLPRGLKTPGPQPIPGKQQTHGPQQTPGPQQSSGPQQAPGLRQTPESQPLGGGTSSAIIDPVRGAPAESRLSVSVAARTATMSDALSTTLVVLSVEQGKALLAQFPSVSAVWLSSAGEVHAAYRQPELELSTGR